MYGYGWTKLTWIIKYPSPTIDVTPVSIANSIDVDHQFRSVACN